MEASSLEKLTQARQWLAEAKTMDDVKHIIDIAEAARVYSRAAKLGLEAQNEAAEIKIRAERKAGEMLAQLERGGGQPYQSTFNSVLKVDKSEYKEVLDDQNINYMTANRWQVIAELPEETFEEKIAETREHEKELTTGGILRAAKEYKRQEKYIEVSNNGKLAPSSDQWHIFQGDIRTWEAPRQYDFIITDPPYPKEYLPLYEVLAQRSREWLKPGGLLIAMCGQSYLDQIYAMMSKHLVYWWTGAYLTPGGQSSQVFPRKAMPYWKPLLIYANGEYTGKWFGDVCKSDVNDNDKSNHEWGQSVSGTTDLIRRFADSGNYILDPFCGAGTTGIAAVSLGCFFDGLDIDSENVNISKGRLSDVDEN